MLRRDSKTCFLLASRLLEDQDEELGLLGEGVRRVRVVATTINDELREQNQILQGIDEEADGVHSRLRCVVGAVNAALCSPHFCTGFLPLVAQPAAPALCSISS